VHSVELAEHLQALQVLAKLATEVRLANSTVDA
jgi:hypothetical protein